MNPIEIGGIVFGCVFGGALVGMFLRTILPQQHLQANSTDVLKLATGLVGTMSGLVLGMLISSGLTFYNLQKTELLQMCTKIILMDRLLADYGKDTDQLRFALRESVVTTMNHMWPTDHSHSSELIPKRDPSTLNEALQALSPNNDRQQVDKAQAIDLAKQIYETQWLMFIGARGNSVSSPLVVIVVSWLTAIFLSYGLLSPHNATVVVTLIFAAIAVSAAIFIIREMYDPFGGLFRITSTPMQYVLDQIGH